MNKSKVGVGLLDELWIDVDPYDLSRTESLSCDQGTSIDRVSFVEKEVAAKELTENAPISTATTPELVPKSRTRFPLTQAGGRRATRGSPLMRETCRLK